MSSMDNIRSFRAWPTTKEIAHHFSSCEPFHLRSVGGIPSGAAVREDLQTVQTLVDVSCASNDESFCGHPAHREKVDIKVADFLAAWNCYESGHMHWLLETDLRLYLSQCCMFCRSDPHLCELPGIEIIKHVCDLVNDNCGITVEQVNLWMNIQHSQSTLHYDANHNLLVLLEGSKTVTLLAPGCTRHLTPACAADEHPNHSSLSPQAVDSLVDAMKKSQDEDDSTYAGCIFHVVTIRAGDALFIPEGWWHQVVSGQCSMALNFWFPSSLQSWLCTDNLAAAPNVDGKPHISMNEYILRAAVHQLVQEEQRRSEVSHVAGSAGGASLYTNLSYQSFQSYILNDLLPAVDSSGVDSAILSGRKRAAVDAESEPTSASTENALERFVCCDFEDMQRLWVPFAAQVQIIAIYANLRSVTTMVIVYFFSIR